jgi:HemY protein
MKWLLFFIVTAIFFGFLGIVYLVNPGSLELIWFGYNIQLSAILAFIILIFLMSILLFMGYSILWLINLPSKWANHYKKSQESNVEAELLNLLTSYEAENFNMALELTQKIKKKLEKNPFFLWIAGNIFEKTKHHLEAEQCFITLIAQPSTFFLGLKGQIRAAIVRSDFNKAYDLLKRAEKDFSSSPWVLKHFLAIAREQKKFIDAEKTALRLDDLGYITKDQSKKQLANIEYQEALQPKISQEQKETYLRQAHYLDPSLTQVSEMLADLLQEQGHHAQALSILQATWDHAPTQTLGDLYLKILSPKNEGIAFEKIKEFVKKNPKNPESLLLLARTGLKAKLWGETRTALKQLLEKHPTAIAYQLMAHLESHEHQNMEAAMEWLEKGLQAPRYAPPPLF